MNLRSAALLLVLGLSGSAASAAPVLVLLNGRIATAEGVVVDGRTYDVDFLDGFCNDVFSGCNASTTFAFDSQSEAEAASQALLDTVFLNLGTFETAYDARFQLTNGCDPAPEVRALTCMIRTPYGIEVTGGGTNIVVDTVVVINGDEPRDGVKNLAIDVTVYPDGQTFPLPDDFNHNYTWARWRLRSTDTTGDTTGNTDTTGTAPEPVTAALLGLGLLIRGARRRRSH